MSNRKAPDGTQSLDAWWSTAPTDPGDEFVDEFNRRCIANLIGRVAAHSKETDPIKHEVLVVFLKRCKIKSARTNGRTDSEPPDPELAEGLQEAWKAHFDEKARELKAHYNKLSKFAHADALLTFIDYYFEACPENPDSKGSRQPEWWATPIKLREPKRKTKLMAAVWHDYERLQEELRQHPTPSQLYLRLVKKQEDWDISPTRKALKQALERLQEDCAAQTDG